MMAQNVIITGKTNKTDALVRLFVYDELITSTGTLIAETRSDAKGYFMLNGDISQILPARIFVGLENADLYLTPNARYDLEIIIPEKDPSASYFEREQPTLRIKTATDKGLYRQIIYSEQIVNSYLMEHFNQIYRGRQLRYIDSIQSDINRELPDISSSFVKDFNRYKLASIKLSISTDHGKRIIKDYFDGKPVLYTLPAYMDLFKELFDNYFNKSQYDIHALNEAFLTGPAAFLDYLNTDPLMAHNPRLAELITIHNLQKMCYGDRETRYYAKAHLDQINKNTRFTEHKTIISNIFKRLNRFATGSEATDFELKDSDNKTVRLSDYKKNLVLLQFVDGQSAVSERQMARLKELHQQWQDSVQIITISTKDQMAAYKKKFDEKHYGWPLLDLGNDILLLEAYDVRTFPEYILIKPDTKIGEVPAPAPDQYLEERVRKLYGK